ncbi:Hemolysin, contains CBS domains [Pseudomonas guineae]|uniref:Hemolysin, contains CBS domains n=1 Tax=Pseudomonas guineae TaxID=425504 RepID=A0A1I3LK89_9PSED|nr:CNNM domain-containing protein [Pseudomonas guineae]SFI84885.1 Hemolysin, contains CBS domains [Pseudomonas guineae]|tara:strand:- start:1607 stop:2644 length:1038 start_codon:yes stop_codon:yes gene_type:complete
MTLLLAFAVLSILVSFICSILEAALLSLTPSYIVQQRAAKPKLYERLKALKDQIDQPLAAILTLNTVAHTVGATGVGAQVTVVFGDGYLGVASAVMTLLILVLSEILPKTIGARYWRTLAPFLPGLLGAMILLLKPFIFLSDSIMRLLGGKEPEHDIRQEIKALALLGRESGQLDEDEQRVIGNILDLHDIKLRDIMTPRIVCESAAPGETISAFKMRVKQSQFSRYPVIDEDESPLGVVFRYDALSAENDDGPVTNILKPLKVVLDTMNVENLMTLLMQERQHMCLVYDEFGSWRGLVTLEDIMETIIGKAILDETDDIPNMRRFAKRRWEHRIKAIASRNTYQ